MRQRPTWRAGPERGMLNWLPVFVGFFLVACDSSSPTEQDEPAEVEWLEDNASPISVSPSVTDFSDLAGFRDAIGSSRVVLLGEQSHGDGTTFLAKTRLIQFLHQELGFDVLAFESGLFDLKKTGQRASSPGSFSSPG